jgi:hypothetical protein
MTEKNKTQSAGPPSRLLRMSSFARQRTRKLLGMSSKSYNGKAQTTTANEKDEDTSTINTPEPCWYWQTGEKEPDHQVHCKDLRTYLTGKPCDEIGVATCAAPAIDTKRSGLRSLLRACQVCHPNAANDDNDLDHCCQMTIDGLVDTVLECDPDILVLNEYFPYDKPYGSDDIRTLLEPHGYAIRYTPDFCPIAVATRLPIMSVEEMQLDLERTALLLQLQSIVSDEAGTIALDGTFEGEHSYVWICILPLCEYDEESRVADTQMVTEWLQRTLDCNSRVLLYHVIQGDEVTEDGHIDALEEAGYDAVSSTNADTDATTKSSCTSPHFLNMKTAITYDAEVDWSSLRMIVSDWEQA